MSSGSERERIVKLSSESVGTVHLRRPGDDATAWRALPRAGEYTVPGHHAVLVRIDAGDSGGPDDLVSLGGVVIDALCLAGNARVDDSWADAITRIEGLRELDLARTRVTDAILQALAAHRPVRAVNLWSTGVTAGGVAAFRAAMPGCRVIFEAPSDLRD